MNLNTKLPILIGLTGPAGVGKTSTGQALASATRQMVPYTIGDADTAWPAVVWEHYWLSLPLYSIYDIKTKTKGTDAQSRIMYGILDVVNSVMMKQIPFDDMIEMVYDLYSLPIVNEFGEKPRTFLQTAGDIFVNSSDQALAKFLKYKIQSDFNNLIVEYDRNEMDELTYISVVSDIRYPHEAKVFLEQPNSRLIRLSADEDILKTRLLDRDGYVLTPDQAQHRTEQSFDLIPKEWYDLTVDTTELSFENQVKTIRKFVLKQGV